MKYGKKVWWGGLILLVLGGVLTCSKLFFFFSSPGITATVTGIESVDGKCRRRSGRKEDCLLQKLKLSYTLEPASDAIAQGYFTPEIQTQLKEGDTLQIEVDRATPNTPRLKTLRGGWGYRLAPMVFGLLLLIIASFQRPEENATTD